MQDWVLYIHLIFRFEVGVIVKVRPEEVNYLPMVAQPVRGRARIQNPWLSLYIMFVFSTTPHLTQRNSIFSFFIY